MSRPSFTALVLGLGLTFAVPGWIASAEAAPHAAQGRADKKPQKKDSAKSKKDTKKADKNDRGFEL